MTSRDMTAGMLAAIDAEVVRPALLYDGVFSGGSPTEDQHLRLWTGVGELPWNGYTWTGGGTLIGISPIEETTNVRAIGFTVTVSGMPSDMVALALAAMKQGRPGTLYLALFDEDGELIPDPYQLQRGRLDIGVIDDDGDKCTIAAQYESRLIDLERPRERRYTSQDQQIDHPTDTGFNQVPALQDAEIQWG